MTKKRLWLTAALMLVLIPVTALAQRRNDPPPLPAGQTPPDPTRPNPRTQAAIDANRGSEGTAVIKMPAMSLKGRVIAKGRVPAALVEIDGRLASVAPGATLMLNSAQTIKIVDVSASHVLIEVSNPKETVSLN